MASALKVDIDQIQSDWGGLKKRLRFDTALQEGFKVTEYHKHQANKNYSVIVAKEDSLKRFSNISANHLALALKKEMQELQQDWYSQALRKEATA